MSRKNLTYRLLSSIHLTIICRLVCRHRIHLLSLWLVISLLWVGWLSLNHLWLMGGLGHHNDLGLSLDHHLLSRRLNLRLRLSLVSIELLIGQVLVLRLLPLIAVI